MSSMTLHFLSPNSGEEGDGSTTAFLLFESSIFISEDFPWLFFTSPLLARFFRMTSIYYTASEFCNRGKTNLLHPFFRRFESPLAIPILLAASKEWGGGPSSPQKHPPYPLLPLPADSPLPPDEGSPFPRHFLGLLQEPARTPYFFKSRARPICNLRGHFF